MKEIYINDIATISKTAKEFISGIGENRIFAFYGKMGAGKTTLISAICKELKVLDVVNSPTFAIVNEYHRQEADSIYHFDFYRIEHVEEAYDFGYEDYFYSNRLCFIEWPEKIEAILPEETVRVEVLEKDNGIRLVQIG